MRSKVLTAIVLLTLLGACGKNNKTASSGASPTATVTLKDGTSVTGSVMKNDASSITVQTPNGVVTTWPIAQVSSVNYGPPPDTSANSAPLQNAQTQPPAPSPAPATPPAAAPTPAPASAPAPAAPQESKEYRPAPTFRTIPAGATLEVRTNETIDAQTAAPGQTYSGEIVEPVVDTNGAVAIPRRATATLVVRDASRQGKMMGRSDLVVDVASVAIGGRTYRLETSNFVEQGKEGVGANKRTAKFAGGGGVFGTIVGAIAGGGKGAAIGALSGAAAGTAAQALTRGKPARIPAETVLRFRLEAPIRIREMQR